MTAAISIRHADPGEAAILTELAQASKASWGYPDEWLKEWQDDLTLSAEFIVSNAVFVAVERRDGGQSTISGVVALEDGVDGPEIAHLWVRPDRQGFGIGRALLKRALEEARSRGWTMLRILSDPYAQAFYESMGAKLVGMHPAPVAGNPRELPILMLSTASH